jgi:hypothetical protein
LKPQALQAQWAVEIEGYSRKSPVWLIQSIYGVIDHLEIISNY